MGSSGVSLVTRDTASEGTLGPPSVLLSLFSSCYEASTLLCHTASSSSPNMGATNRRLRGQLGFKKNYRREGKIEMCPRFQYKEIGGRHGDILPTIPFKNGELTSSAAIELLPPGLQSCQVLWLMAAAEEL